jgi:hypothetical protein
MPKNLVDRAAKYQDKMVTRDQSKAVNARQKVKYNSQAQGNFLLDNKIKLWCAGAGYTPVDMIPMLDFGRKADKINRVSVGATIVAEWHFLVNQFMKRGVDYSDMWALVAFLFGYSHPATILVTVPDGGEDWHIGQINGISWNSVGIVGNIDIEISADSGMTYVPLVSDVPNTGMYAWDIAVAASATRRIKVLMHEDHSVADASNADFTVSVQPDPVCSAGPDTNTGGVTPFHIMGDSASEYSTLLWTTAGDGVFTDATVLHPWYTPGANDIMAGSVVLTITAQPIPPNMTVVFDDMTLTIP